ncbi:homing endonuclease associated repeat-containing protein [Halomicrococcus sp. SG-WS-1]|uniref:homing endonuclease associated repeat-containing protein n=1 Tax=Halomicrococcus sp. SG-WS-1 TaxID=3439057 RepID=UPI003F79D1FB
MTTEFECISSLREAAVELDESPTKAQYEQLGLTPAASTIGRVFNGWNRAKEAAGLETYRSTGSRVQPKPEAVELPDDRTWEELSANQRWHYKHSDQNCKQTLDRRRANRAWVHRYKQSSSGCARCNETDPACLDFHHLNEDEKEMAVGKMVTYGYSKSQLEEEIKKCLILCANCHRKEHSSPLDTVDPRPYPTDEKCIE